MASQDLISQFSQGIPATQPDRSPSRTPRREHAPAPGASIPVPQYRGPVSMATQHFHNRPYGMSHPWTPPRLPTMTTMPTLPSSPTMPWNYVPPSPQTFQQQFPPVPPACPPPPPPLGPTTPQRFITTSPKSTSPATPSSVSQIHKGYPVRPCEIPPMPNWKPDVDYHDTGKANGIDFPATVRSSRFSQYKDIEGMDPLQIPLWKFLYQGLNNTWLRRIAHGRDVFVHPCDNIGTTVFVAELVQQLKSRNVDLDRLAAYRSRQQSTQLQQKEATQAMAREVAQHMQSWLPTSAAPDPSSQQRILQLEAQLAELKANGKLQTESTPSGSTPTAPIFQALHGQAPVASTFSPSSLLVMPGAPNAWLEKNPVPSISQKAYSQWLRDLKLPQPKMDVLERNLEKALEWWNQQPDSANDSLQRFCGWHGPSSQQTHHLEVRLYTKCAYIASPAHGISKPRPLDFSTAIRSFPRPFGCWGHFHGHWASRVGFPRFHGL